jgi:predicted nucleic acid-binding protein
VTTGIVDTTVIIHYFRKLPAARAWIDTQPAPLSITTITWLEVIQGAPGKIGQAHCKALLSQFELTYLVRADQDWAMEQMERYRLSHGVGINDCLIASVAYRLQVPLYTHNLKDMTPMIGELAVKPYE